MEILNLLNKKQKNLIDNKSITIAFLGDSVTQGCFDVYLTSDTSLETVFDCNSSYSTRLKEILNILYPNVQINIINSGISGDSAKGGLNRLERDVLSFNPDLCVVSFGLNDACSCTIDEYLDSLSKIFIRLKEKNVETIFLTQNSMCTKVSCHLKEKLLKDVAQTFLQVQNEGKLKKYFDKAKELCLKYSVKICDLYSIWDKMIENGVDTTELLANHLNHPIREYHYYIALKILEIIFDI